MNKIVAESEQSLRAFNDFLKKCYEIEPLNETEIVKDYELQQLFENCLFVAFQEGQEYANETQKGHRESSPLKGIVSVPFTGMQLSIIAKAVEAFLVDDTIIVDDDGNLHDELTINLKNDAQGIRYYLGLEDIKPDYFKD